LTCWPPIPYRGGLDSITGQPEEPPGAPTGPRTILALAALAGATTVPSRETEIPYGYTCTACGQNVHTPDCQPPRGLRQVAAGFRPAERP